MSITAVIPARSGSKGVKDKNISDLMGHPLLAYSIMAARSSKLVDSIVVSTDSEIYAEISSRYGAEVPYLRPSSISTDDSTDVEWVLHFLDWLTKRNVKWPELLVHLRPTTPLRDPNLIDTAINVVQSNSAVTALRSIQAMSQTAYKYFEIEDEYLRTIFNNKKEIDEINGPRHHYPETFQPNGYVDVLRPLFISQSGVLHGGNVSAFITPKVIEIDTVDDLELLRFMIERNPELIKTLVSKIV